MYLLTADSDLISVSGASCWNMLLVARNYPSKLENPALQKFIP